MPPRRSRVPEKSQEGIRVIEAECGLGSFKTIAGTKRVGMKKTPAMITMLQAKKRHKVRIRACRTNGGAKRVSRWSARAAKIKQDVHGRTLGSARLSFLTAKKAAGKKEQEGQKRRPCHLSLRSRA